MTTFNSLEDSPLFRLQSKSQLARLLGISVPDLRSLARVADGYREWDMAKPDGGKRRIEHPNSKLKTVQKKIANLLGSIEPPPYLFCPVRGRSAFDNATLHKMARSVATIDIRSFFQSSAETRVIWFFRQYMGCSPDITYLLTKLTCHRGHLPTGAPSSPILAHYAYRDLWDEIDRLCRVEGLKLTIWIDDLTISGDIVKRSFLWSVKQTIARYRLKYHPERRTISGSARVTGVMLHSDKSLGLPHKLHRKVHSIETELRDAEVRGDRRALERLGQTLAGLRSHEVQMALAAERSGFRARRVPLPTPKRPNAQG